jgi:hypothetical protein
LGISKFGGGPVKSLLGADEPAFKKKKMEASEASESIPVEAADIIPVIGMHFTNHSHPYISISLFQVGY